MTQERHTAILQAINLCSTHLLKSSGWKQSIHEVFELLGHATGVSCIYLFHCEQLQATLLYDWYLPGVQLRKPQQLDLSGGELATWVDTLQSGYPLYGSAGEFPTPEQYLFKTNEATTVIIIPLHVYQTWWGFMGFDTHVDNQHVDWDAIEINALQMAVNLVAAAVERELMQTALQNSEEQYRKLVEGQIDLVVKLDKDKKLAFASRSCYEVLGITEDNFPENSFVPYIHKQDRPATKEAIDTVYSPPYIAHFEHRLLTINGWRWFEWQAAGILDKSNQYVVEAIGTGRDITEKKEAELALKQSEALFFEAFRASSDAIVIARVRDLNVLDVNDAFMDICQVGKRDMLLGKAFNTLPLWADEKNYEQMQAVLQKGKSVHGLEVTFLKSNNEILMGLVSFSYITVEAEPCVLIQVHDITEKQQAAQRDFELQFEKKRTEILKEFIIGISHEVNTPLSVIHTSAYMLGKITDPEKQARYLEKINLQTDSIQHLIRAMVTLTSFDSDLPPKLEIVYLNPLLKVVKQDVQALADEKSIQIVMQLDENQPRLYANASELHVAFEHILRNAIQHSESHSQIKVVSKIQGKSVMVSITDEGAGISEADLPHIFERFYRGDKARSTRGFGLGLPIASKVIQRHEGSIKVHTKEHEGSCFEVILPLDTSSAGLISSGMLGHKT